MIWKRPINGSRILRDGIGKQTQCMQPKRKSFSDLDTVASATITKSESAVERNHKGYVNLEQNKKKSYEFCLRVTLALSGLNPTLKQSTTVKKKQFFQREIPASVDGSS